MRSRAEALVMLAIAAGPACSPADIAQVAAVTAGALSQSADPGLAQTR